MSMVRRLAIALAMIALAGEVPSRRVPEPEATALDNYRSPVPATLKGGRSSRPKRPNRSGAAARRLLSTCCRIRRGQICLRAPCGRQAAANIPGSIWLPDTGYGELAPSTGRLFRDRGSRRRPTANAPDCSCSIVWRIAGCRGTPRSARCALGYPNVAWYPGRHRWLARRRATDAGCGAGAAPGRVSRLHPLATTFRNHHFPAASSFSAF